MRISYDVIEIDNYLILSTLHNLHFGEYSIFVYRFGLKKIPNLILARYLTPLLF